MKPCTNKCKLADEGPTLVVDTEKHVWCPTCKALPGVPCKLTRKQSAQLHAAALQDREQQRTTLSIALKNLHIDHDGETQAHLSRISRADSLALGMASPVKWRHDELLALIARANLKREGKA